ncbi:lysophospholipid acyltransferase family protein [Candidatus Poriferisodalis sp.]|uniref:lysophospholipid acyltransferase family protein n=1 Tax=Candidatus Poriferisodalis sp. TaxID=3101277 RepID=UPI003B51BC4F
MAKRANRWKLGGPGGLLAADGMAGYRAWRATRGLIRIVLYRMFRVRATGQERLRANGPLIYAPVHRSHLDGPLVGSLTHHQVRYLGKEELFHPKPLGWFMRSIGTFPVRRGEADLDAMRAALQLLRDGAAMLVFPEGTRQPSDDIGPIFDGTAWLAAKSGAPVLPVGVAGTREAMPSGAKFPKRTQVAIVVGEPLAPPTGPDGGRARRADMTAWTATLRDALEDCQQRARALANEPGRGHTPMRELVP